MNPWWLAEALSSLDGLWRHGRRSTGIRVLVYHGVIERKKDPVLERNFVPLQDFHSHIRLLRRYRVLSLAELVDEIHAGTRKTRPAVVITFDDGHANNLLAAEVLGKFRMPWSSFIPTAAIGRENSIWTTEVSLLLLKGRIRRLEILNKDWRLEGRQERESTYYGILRVLKAMPSAPRKDAMDSIRQQFSEGETLRLLNEFPSMQMLSWEEVGHLQSSNVEIGSHGVDHEIHHSAQPKPVRWFELTESKAVLERRLAGPCDFFVFPNGDFTPTSADEVRAAGYKLAFTTQPGIVSTEANPYLLPRTGPAASLSTFASQFFWPRVSFMLLNS
ncbi:MAG: polysaccharide deacetylase family protein [Terriglobia bacterium]